MSGLPKSTPVVRTDYLDGVQIPVGPPSLTGNRGHTLPAAAAIHSMVFKGKQHEIAALAPEDTFDLIIVGAGLSGLSAAFFYRQRFGPDKTILILDTLEDFGGHAKRNEFIVDGKRLIGYGGSESLQSPNTNFSDTTKALMKDLGVDYERFASTYFQHALYPGLGLTRASFFDRDKYGKDSLVKGDPTVWVADDMPHQFRTAQSVEKFIAGFPLSEKARQELVDLYTSKRVTLAHLSKDARISYLAKTNYSAFLHADWQISDEAIGYFRQRTLDFFGLPPNNISALDAGAYGYPGLQGVDVPLDEEAQGELSEPYVYHFPDGNASLARMLVRSLIPAAAPGNSMEDIVLAPFDYSKLDIQGQKVRLRLNCAVVRVANVTQAADTHVDVCYHHNTDQSLHRAHAKQVILACFNMAIPYMLQGLEEKQAAALKRNVKAPLVYTNVAVRNWHPWVKLGVQDIYGVSSFHSRIKLDFPVTMGGYTSATDSSQPILLHLVHVPIAEGVADPANALRAGRKTFFGKEFQFYEQAIRTDLTRMLGSAGFDADRDVAAITVNRWSHGYSWAKNSLRDDEADANAAKELARKPVGNVVIASADAAWSPYAHSAFDQAFRAVNELASIAASSTTKI